MALIKKFTATGTVTEPLVQAGPDLIPKATTGLGDLGAGISKLGEKFKKIEDNRDIAEGIARYNNIVNAYNESLVTKDPSEYVKGFNELQANITGLTKDMSPEAANVLKNKTVIWNEVNRASLATLAIKQTAAFAKQEMPNQLASFVANDQIEEGEEFIDNYGETVLSPKEVKLWQDKFKSMQAEWDMEESINLAVETGSQEHITDAEKKIKEFYRTDEFEADPRAEFSALSRLRGGVGAARSELTEARKALINKEAEGIAAAAIENEPFNGSVTDENQDLSDRINNRIANDSMGMSDGITFDNMRETLLGGKRGFSERELLEGLAGTDSDGEIKAGGMSTTEYDELVKLNNQVKPLDINQQERMVSFNAEITAQYSELSSALRSSVVGLRERPRVLGAIADDKMNLKKQVVSMIKDGKSNEEINKVIQGNFFAKSKQYTRTIFGSAFLGRVIGQGVGNFTDAVQTTTDRDAQNKIMLDILKDNPNTDNIDDLFELFIK
jgi:hypothetical protein